MIKKSTALQPAQVAMECVCLNLRRAARSVSRRYDEALRPVDLNNGQFSMLNVVAGLQPASVQTVADHLAMDRTTVTAALKPLQRRLLVEITVSEFDLRSRDVVLTRAGRAVLNDALPLWKKVQDELANELGEAGVHALLTQLSVIDGDED